jgi:hypothetical protein
MGGWEFHISGLVYLCGSDSFTMDGCINLTDLTLDYANSKYVLIEHCSGDSENEPYPFTIVCERKTAGDIIDFVVENYSEEDTISISELMSLVLEIEAQERFSEIKDTFSKVSNSALESILRHIMDSFGLTGSIDYPKNEEDSG